MATKNTPSQPSVSFEFEVGRVHEILSDLGYQLQDFGQYYRTRALYRGGDSTNSLKVWKNSGFCIDYAADTKFPLKELLSHHIQDWRKIKEILGGQRVSAPIKIEKKITMPRIYPPDCLDRLLPNYVFYEKRGISKNVQRQYKIGYATTGKMYQRMVFPIYDENGQIIGFSGRHIDYKEENNAPKWKHLGEKQEWLFPMCLSQEFRLPIEEAEEIFLIESIGDSLALSENGIFNHLVCFGLGIGVRIISKLLELNNLKRIIISFNDDSDKLINSGEKAALKAYIKLKHNLPHLEVNIKPPLKNDFGEMLMSKDSFSKWKKAGSDNELAIQNKITNSTYEFTSEEQLRYKKILKSTNSK